MALNVGGLPSLFLPEPCDLIERSNEPDGACPPSCVLCGCCAQPAVPSLFGVDIAADLPAHSFPPAVPALVSVDPREILHVPRSSSFHDR